MPNSDSADASQVVWIEYELDGELEEIELSYGAETTVADLRHKIFDSQLVPLPLGITEKDLALGYDTSLRFRAEPAERRVADSLKAGKNTLTLHVSSGALMRLRNLESLFFFLLST